MIRSFSSIPGTLFLLAAVCHAFISCRTTPPPGTPAMRLGDEMVVAGQFIHTSTPIVLWMDPGGYDAYRVERRFAPYDESNWDATREKVPGLKTPNRYGLRTGTLAPEELARVRGGGWDLPLLQKTVDQFVIHFDVCGTSRQCFKVLHDIRGLSVHFLLDADGTLYQTLDLKERAWHATVSNSRSIGIEIAHIGAYAAASTNNPLSQWYAPGENGETLLTIPERFHPESIRTPRFIGKPARPQLIRGTIQGRELVQYDFTPEQYAALEKLTAALCRTFPKIRRDYPRDDAGQLIPHKLPDDELDRYQGILGHFHIQQNKVDPGPAFQWDRVIGISP